MRRTVTLLMLAGLGGCALWPGTELPVSDLVGQVQFAPVRTAQATLTEVGVAATVSLISASNNRTVSSTITDNTGRFGLSFKTWKPTLGEVYYLEAVKGLNQNLAGNSVARVRTMGQWRATGWEFLTPGLISVTSGTTAVAILASHLGTASVPVDHLIQKVAVGVPDDSLQPGTGDTFQFADTGITNAQYHKVYDLVVQALSADSDPVDRIVPLDGTFVLKSLPAANGGGFAVAPTVYTAVPNSAPIGAMVTLYGKDFAGAKVDNTVLFGTQQATIISSSPDQIVVQVPVGAVTGNLTIRTAGGTSVALSFTVVASDPTAIGGTFAPR